MALAGELLKYSSTQSIVFGMGLGGALVGKEVARRLGATLDLLLVQPVRLPCNEPVVLGAVGPGGACVFDDALIDQFDVENDVIVTLRSRAASELALSNQSFRGGRPLPDVTRKTVLVIDDIVAGTLAMHAALVYLRQHDPRSVILAAPVITLQAQRDLSSLATEVVALEVVEEVTNAERVYTDATLPNETLVRRLLGLPEQASAAAIPPRDDD
jgi:putative phosphoribosyl transferase